MIQILYRGALHNYAIEGNYSGGMVASFVGNRSVGICNDKKIPIGFFINDDRPAPFEMASAWPDSHTPVMVGTSEFQTDVFEESDYKINDFVYCSENGKITNEQRYWGSIIIGIVNHVEPSCIGIVTCLARNLEFAPSGPIATNLRSRYDLLKKT